MKSPLKTGRPQDIRAWNEHCAEVRVEYMAQLAVERAQREQRIAEVLAEFEPKCWSRRARSSQPRPYRIHVPSWSCYERASYESWQPTDRHTEASAGDYSSARKVALLRLQVRGYFRGYPNYQFLDSRGRTIKPARFRVRQQRRTGTAGLRQ